MKKIVFVLFASLAFISAKAQPGTTITIRNDWQCDAYIDIKAVCPDDDCDEYSSGVMAPLPSAPNEPPSLNWGISWFPSPPPCSNWVWDYADIVFFCPGGGGGTIRVGNKNSPCNLNDDYAAFTIPQDCADACFSGKTIVQASWAKTATGDIQLRIW